MAGIKDLYTLDQGCLSAKLVCPSVVIHQLHQSRFMACKGHSEDALKSIQCTETGCSPARSQLLSHPERVDTTNSPQHFLRDKKEKART